MRIAAISDIHNFTFKSFYVSIKYEIIHRYLTIRKLSNLNLVNGALHTGNVNPNKTVTIPNNWISVTICPNNSETNAANTGTKLKNKDALAEPNSATPLTQNK